MSNINNCSICQPTEEETKLIQDALFDKLVLQKQQLKFADQAIQEISEDIQGFSRLLRIIFNKKFKNLKATRSCKHHFLKKEFSSKLKCNAKLLDFISNNVSNRIAKYNFHMDTVSMQTKTFPRHFFNESTSTPPKVQKDISKESTEKKTEKMEPHIPQRVEELQNNQQTQLKREDPIILSNTIPINSYMTPIIQFPQTYQTMYQPMNFSWGFSFPSEQFQQNNKKQKE